MGARDVAEYMAAGERRQARWERAGTVARTLGSLLALGAVLFVTCNLVQAGDERALEAVRASGLRDAKLGGADAMACAMAESSRHFTAINSLDKRVEGTVCCGVTGLGKGCMIRWGRSSH
ncbi:MAG TPA: hypothetical protein VK601_07015 [Kofleriaceae bacterium]|nr:hypothetical protein [Kofleriaceae bacterium]